MKIKNKGKVYPSPPCSVVNLERETDYFSVIKLLPAAILTLASVLSLEDREVLAYMISRSMKTTTNSSNPNPNNNTSTNNNPSFLSKKSSKKQSNLDAHFNSTHKVPIFDCDCFDCYTSYWFRWDSSPNRELIHQAIEAFEDHLSFSEKSKKPSRSKRREKSGRRFSDKSVNGVSGGPEMVMEPKENENDKVSVAASVSSSPDDDVSPVYSPEISSEGKQVKGIEGVTEVPPPPPPAAEMEDAAVVNVSPAAVNNHKGLARKVLPDVLGILNSRLWSLWDPNV